MIIIEEDFDDATFEGVTVIMFFAEYSTESDKLFPVVSQIENFFGEKIFSYQIDTDEYPAVAERFDIKYIPTVGIYNEGVPIVKIEGVHPYEIYAKKISELLQMKEMQVNLSPIQGVEPNQ